MMVSWAFQACSGLRTAPAGHSCRFKARDTVSSHIFCGNSSSGPGELRNYLQKYMQAFMAQTAQTAACNRVHGIEERLARWLLTCRDRMPSNQLRLTQTFLGQMLGAPRTTVTLAVGILERAGLIDHARGTVVIRNRAQLENTACECYRTVRDEYKRYRLL